MLVVTAKNDQEKMVDDDGNGKDDGERQDRKRAGRTIFIFYVIDARLLFLRHKG